MTDGDLKKGGLRVTTDRTVTRAEGGFGGRLAVILVSLSLFILFLQYSPARL